MTLNRVIIKREDERQKVIVFDLDETLVHCLSDVNLPSQHKITINYEPGV